jgi:hypothetical protein
VRPCLKIPITKRAGRMVQGEGLEFKPQYCKKKKKKKEKRKQNQDVHNLHFNAYNVKW